MTGDSFPSPIVKIDQPGIQGRSTVLIPRNETFRVRKIFEEHEYGVPPEFIPSGSLTIVDIGANVGLFALYVKNIRMDCDIFCFEPVPQTMRLLEKNVAHHHRIHALPYALSDRDETAGLRLHPINSGENSLKRGASLPAQSIQVHVKDAANVFNQIGLTYVDILKIDTEGCEVEILKSLKPFLPYVGIVMAEYHSESDRRAIDALLPDHLLFDASPCKVHLGLVKYINSRLIGQPATKSAIC